jgi:hypothetical protein
VSYFLNKITYFTIWDFRSSWFAPTYGLAPPIFEKNEFLKNFISPGLDRGRGRDGDENFFFTNFFFIAITTAIKTATSTSKFLVFLSVVFFHLHQDATDNPGTR